MDSARTDLSEIEKRIAGRTANPQPAGESGLCFSMHLMKEDIVPSGGMRAFPLRLARFGPGGPYQEQLPEFSILHIV